VQFGNISAIEASTTVAAKAARKISIGDEL
jgi:hypothetical protein